MSDCLVGADMDGGEVGCVGKGNGLRREGEMDEAEEW